MREELIKRFIIYIYDEDNGKIMLDKTILWNIWD